MSRKDFRALKIHCPVSRLAGPGRTNEEKVNKLCADAGDMYIVLAPVSLSKGHIKIGIICISTDGVTVGDGKYPTLYISFPSARFLHDQVVG